MGVVLITGCSSGIGKLSALEFARRGATVYATMRDLAKAQGLRTDAEQAGLSIETLQLDVTDHHSIQSAVGQVLERSGRIDVLVNNAGFSTFGPVECYRDDEIAESFDTNVTGAIRVTRAVLPTMRGQKAGRIINISSISGLFSFPFHGIYAACKHALEAISDALYFELIPYGIDVVLIEPGDFRTEIYKNQRSPESVEQGAIPSEYQRAMETTRSSSQSGGSDPGQVAMLIADAAEVDGPKRRYLVGEDAKEYMAISPGELENRIRRWWGFPERASEESRQKGLRALARRVVRRVCRAFG
jgi:NAD(P)-dependent dehydrogenase (short-subunit alcohol dehydrogenase family)